MRNFTFLLLSILFLFPTWSYAEEINAGFVQGLWYSKDPVFAQVPTRIYVALRNNTEHDLTGTVRFTDNGKRIGSSEVRALSGRLVEAWVDWTPTSGEHKISATVSDATLHVIGGGTQAIDITGILAEDTLTIEYDTDKDGVGDAADTDDDGDGVSDEDEKKRGTDPLVANPNPTKTTEQKVEDDDQDERDDERVPAERSDAERGLEKYVGEGTMDTLLSSVTGKVENTKQSLDAYRDERNNELYSKKSSTSSNQTTIGMPNGNATITREQIKTKGNLMHSFVSGVATFLKNIWTFVLWVTSRALTYPALIELVLLLGTLYMIYRTARRFGRRQNN